MNSQSVSINLTPDDMRPSSEIFEGGMIHINFDQAPVSSESISYVAIIFDLTELQRMKMALAAKSLLDDYEKDKELTIFTEIDPEPFHEQG